MCIKYIKKGNKIYKMGYKCKEKKISFFNNKKKKRKRERERKRVKYRFILLDWAQLAFKK